MLESPFSAATRLSKSSWVTLPDTYLYDGMKPDLFAIPPLSVHINFGGRVGTDQDHAQTRRPFAGGDRSRHDIAHLVSEFSGNLRPVEYFRGHGTLEKRVF